jgi:N-acetylglucosamine-6-sulfatase
MRKALALAVLAAAVVPAAASTTGSTAVAAKARPNVIVIETDDQSVNTMQAMPNVVRLIGAQGATFTNSFVSFSLCCPSRATFLTGQYAHNHGVLGNGPPEGGYAKLDHTNTLAVWLQRAGYYTVEVGKYLNGYGRPNPLEIPPGWNEWYAGVNLAFLGGTMNQNGKLVRLPRTEDGYQTDVYARIARDVIRRRAPSSQPFFLWLTPHVPHNGGPPDPDDPRGIGTTRPAARHRDRFASEPLPEPPSFNEQDVSDKPMVVRNRPLLTPQRVAGIREAYQQQLESLLAVDEAVAGIVADLRAAGELANTLIVYTSDNGFFHGEHRVPQGKVLLYEPSIRVPLLMRGPGVPRGVRRREIVANIDLAPTIVDAANAKAGRRRDGRSLLPLLGRKKLKWRSDLLLESGNGRRNGFVAVRTTRYVYAEYADGERELYDLAKDPFELQSRHADPAYAAIRARLARRLAALRSCAGARCR